MADDFKPLNDLVDRMRKKTGYDKIPRFSTEDGGTDARCLFLFQTPNAIAGSGQADMNNPDPSARNVKNAIKDAELDRTLTISWNIVPWEHPNPPAATVWEALPWLGDLLELLPNLRVVVLCGGTAQMATRYLYINYSELCIIHAPHPSLRSLGNQERREHFWAAMQKAAVKAQLPES